MDKKLYDELRKIENRLYNIAKENGEMYNSELGDAWALLYGYLEKIKNITRARERNG